MNLGKSLMSLATAPARVGLAAADAGVGIATSALGIAWFGVPSTGLGGRCEQRASPRSRAKLWNVFERKNPSFEV